jgi:hypothetical protein
LRLALGTALSYVTAETLGWDLSFLITVFVVQLLTAPGRAPGFVQGIAVVVVLALATGAAATVSELLVGMPSLFAVVLGVVLFLSFLLQRSGRSPAIAMLVLVAFSLIPVVAVQAPDAAPEIALLLVRSSAIAMIWTWLLHAVLPDAESGAHQAPATPPMPAPGDAVRVAVTDTAVLLPVLLTTMALAVPAALVIILTVTAMPRQHSLAGGRKVILGLLLGNLMGGLTAVAAYQLLSAVPTLAFLAGLMLLVSLLYARQIEADAARRPLFVTGLITFVIVFGMAVAPLLDEPGATLTIRLLNLAIACLYTGVALSLIARDGRQARQERRT